MPNLIFNRIDYFISLLKDRNYREYLQLLIKYGSLPRNQKHNIRFLSYNIDVPDCPSFVFQFKDIFVKNIYKFSSDKKDPLIYDCGANIGISCIYFKELYPSARIKAFEADPDISQMLKNNLSNNGINDVEINSMAVWTKNDKVEFNPDGADGGSINKNSSNHIKVDSVRLRDLLLKEDKVDLIKMDIEGAEVEVIADCNESLKIADKIFIEFHSWGNYDQKLDLLLKILKGNGFTYFIESISQLDSPFIGSKVNKASLQLNIFASRNG